MALFIILLLVLAAVAGLLGTVVKVALGVALGLFAGFLLIVWLVMWRVRRAIYGGRSRPGFPGPRWRRIRGSSVEILDPSHRPQ
jgi:hypothetical protein